MPCSDGGNSDRERAQESYEKLKKVEAMLCAVIRAAGPNVIDRIDEKESGISRTTLRRWWGKHQEEDNRRKRREQREAEQKRLRQKALGKLSADERKALGL